MILLHVHNSDSILDGLGTQLQNAERVAELGHTALAESNHGNLSGSLKHIKACKQVGIMPICGIETYWRPNRLVRDKEWRYRKWHLVLLAKNLIGWHNLMKISSAAYCVTPETRILTSNLQWAEARDLNVGDDLVGFDEKAPFPGRKIKNSKVLKIGTDIREVYKFVLVDGTSLRCSAEHPWLTRNGGKDGASRWRTSKEIAEKFESFLNGSSRKPPDLIRYLKPWEQKELNYDAGYLAGAFDSEGSLFASDKSSLTLTFTQKDNCVLDNVKRILDKNRIAYWVNEDSRKCFTLKIKNRQNALETIGSFKIDRLVEKYKKYLKDNNTRATGILQAIDYVQIEDIVYEGKQEIIPLETSSHTYFAEGFGAHNSSGYYQFPCVDWELLEKYHEGLIMSTSCILGPLPFLIENGTDKETAEWIHKAQSIFHDDVYFSIMPHNFDRQRAVNLEIISLANRFGAPIVYEGDSHYPYKGWVDTQKIAILVGINKDVKWAEEQNKKRLENNEEIYELWHDGLHLMDEKEVCEAFAKYHPDIPSSTVIESINNTDEIGSRIEPFIMDRSTKMPRAGKSPGEAEKKVIQWCREGLRKYGRDGDPIYEQRLEYEIGVIRKRDNYDYFMLTADWVRWSRSSDPLPGDSAEKKPMRIGSGRGSVAASLVSYLCNITTVDPIAHKLKFERFLNPERKGLPDIDIDFPSRRRNEGKEYQARKNGRENIADVVAHQTFRPRAALKSVTKVLYGFDSDAYTEIARICHEDSGLIDAVHDSDLELMRPRIEDLNTWARLHPFAWNQAVRLENKGDSFVSRLSKHAGGIVITPGSITDYMPTLRSDEKEVGFRTAWSETPRLSIVDDFGFVKWDALAIEGMDQQQLIIDSVFDRTGNKIDLDSLPCLKDPYDVDENVMEAFHKGLNLGVNQFQGNGVTGFMKKAKPENIVDLAAINALYRPGPMGAQGHIHYARRKNQEEEFTIPDILRPILSDTYSIISFQEQVMELFEVLAEYTPGESDGIRKIIAKLYRERGNVADEALNEHKKFFIEKASEKIGVEEANRIWEEILPYTEYSFNRAHATGYAIQAYQDQWLKVRYPLESYATIMSLEPKDSLRAIKEARYFDIKILPPDVNISNASYTPDFENSALRYGLNGIKGLADTSSEQVMKLRPYLSLDDFEKKQTFKYSKCNKGHREKLLRVGALDSLGGRDTWSDTEKAEAEMELLGMALSAGGTLGEDEALVISKTHSEEEYNALEKGSNVVIGGVISEMKKVKTKKGKNPGQDMSFIKISLGLDSFQCTLFPSAWSVNKDLLQIGNKVMISGRKDDRGVIVNNMMLVDDWAAEMRGELVAA